MKAKRILASVVATVMMLGTMSFPVFAEGNVAKIGEKEYGTLAEAVTEAESGATITLIANATEATTVNIKKNVTIDFDGKTLYGSIKIAGTAEVTIRNGYIRQEELISGIEVAENSKVTINNMDIESFRHAVRIDSDANDCVATAVINGGKYVSKNNNTTCHAINIGTSNPEKPRAKSVVTINSGEFYGPVNNATGGNSLMVQSSDDDVKVYDGYFAKASGIEGCVCPTNGLKIYGGTFETWSYDSYLAEGKAVTQTGDKFKVVNAVAKINTKNYGSLADAVAAAKSGDTITLLGNTKGDGVVVPSGSNITIDLGGFTYNVDGTTVGSTGTKTQAFQLLRDSVITIKNGTITSDKAKMLIQNYSNLTLEDVTLDGSNLDGTNLYVLSNNFGNTVITGNTNIIAKEGDVAFDCYYWPNGGYGDGVTVTLGTDFTGKITGKIEMSDDGTDSANAASKQSISISGGTFTVDVSEYLVPGCVMEGNTVVNKGAIWSTAQDAGYFMDGETKKGVMRYLFNVSGMNITGIGIQTESGNTSKSSVAISGESDIVFGFDFIYTEAEATKDSYTLKGYAIINGKNNYSSDVTNEPNWTKLLAY